MDNTPQPVAPMPRMDFAGMTDKTLLAYLKVNQVYVSRDDRIATRADMLATANLVADRKAEDFLAAREQAETLNRAVNETSAKLQELAVDINVSSQVCGNVPARYSAAGAGRCRQAAASQAASWCTFVS